MLSSLVLRWKTWTINTSDTWHRDSEDVGLEANSPSESSGGRWFQTIVWVKLYTLTRSVGIYQTISPTFQMGNLHSHTLATCCKEMTYWKIPWCWERLKAGGEGSDRGWDGWMASLTRWTWVWVNSGSWWWAGRPGVLQFMGSQRIRHNWETELNWTETPLPMELSRPEYWSEMLFPSPGHLSNPRIEPRSFTLQVDSLPSEPPGKAANFIINSFQMKREYCKYIAWILKSTFYHTKEDI